MKNKVYTMVRRDQDGIDINIYVDMYEVPETLVENGKEEDILTFFRRIAKEYMRTDEGKKELDYNCGNFNWNDFANIPERFLKQYGVRSIPITSNFYTEVNANESLI